MKPIKFSKRKISIIGINIRFVFGNDFLISHFCFFIFLHFFEKLSFSKQSFINNTFSLMIFQNFIQYLKCWSVFLLKNIQIGFRKFFQSRSGGIFKRIIL